jgi:hypothetical protein
MQRLQTTNMYKNTAQAIVVVVVVVVVIVVL